MKKKSKFVKNESTIQGQQLNLQYKCESNKENNFNIKPKSPDNELQYEVDMFRELITTENLVDKVYKTKSQDYSKMNFGENQDKYFLQLNPGYRVQNNLDKITNNFPNVNSEKRILEIVNENQVYGFEEKSILNEDKCRFLKKIRAVYDSFSESELDDPNQNSWYIHPRNQFKQSWDMLMTFSIIFSITYLPYGLAFQEIENQLIYGLITDFIFLIDLYLNFFTAFYDREDNLISNKKKISVRYLKTWFKFDLITSIPTDLLIMLSQEFCFLSNNLYYKLYKWMRIIRGLKLNSTNSFLLNSITKKLKNTNIRITRMLIFLVFLTIVTHIVSCFFIFIANCNPQNNWIEMNNFQYYESNEIYLIAVYFSLTTIFTIGYGDVSAKSSYEFLFCIFLLTIGCAMFSYALTSVSNIITSDNDKELEIIRKQNILDDIKSSFPVPSPLYNQIRKSFKSYYRGTNEEVMKILDSLPSSLKNNLILQMYKKQIQKMKFFHGQSYEFIIATIPLLKTSIYSKGSIIVGMGSLIDEMYLVYEGVISVQLSQQYEKFELAKIRPGNHFGDIFMYSNNQSSLNLIVKSVQAQIYILKKLDFAQLKLQYSQSVEIILKRSLKTFLTIESRRDQVINHYNKFGNLSNFRHNLGIIDNEEKDELLGNFLNDNLTRNHKIIKTIINLTEKIDLDQISSKEFQRTLKSNPSVINLVKPKRNYSYFAFSNFEKALSEENTEIRKRKSTKAITDMFNKLSFQEIKSEIKKRYSKISKNAENFYNNEKIYKKESNQKINNFIANKHEIEEKLTIIEEEEKSDHSKRSVRTQRNSQDKDLKKKRDFSYNEMKVKKKLISTENVVLNCEKYKKGSSLDLLNKDKTVYSPQNQGNFMKSPDIGKKLMKISSPTTKVINKLKLFENIGEELNISPLSKKQVKHLPKNSEDDLFLKDIGNNIHNDGFLNKNHEIVGEYLKGFLLNENQKKNEYLLQSQKLENVLKLLKKFDKKD